jgi:hypothetical protein
MTGAQLRELALLRQERERVRSHILKSFSEFMNKGAFTSIKMDLLQALGPALRSLGRKEKLSVGFTVTSFYHFLNIIL